MPIAVKLLPCAAGARVSPSVITPLAIETHDVATSQSQALIFLNMCHTFCYYLFSGGANVIIDVTAGERERSSLEPLLINPVRRWELCWANCCGVALCRIYTAGIAHCFRYHL